MSTPALVMWAVVLFIGVPSSWRNPTSLALTLSWLFGETVWLMTGNNLPLRAYFMADVTVIAVVYAKTIRRCGTKQYPSMREQMRCLVTDLTKYDRCVVAIFLLGAWPLYVLSVQPYYQWWALYCLTIAQFCLAGAEAALSFRHFVKERAKSDHSGNGLALAGAARGYG